MIIAAYCGILNVQANGVIGSIALYPGNEQYCRAGEVLQFKDGPVIKEINCSGKKIMGTKGHIPNRSSFGFIRSLDYQVSKRKKYLGAGLEITDVDGNISYPWSPTVECVSGIFLGAFWILSLTFVNRTIIRKKAGQYVLQRTMMRV